MDPPITCGPLALCSNQLSLHLTHFPWSASSHSRLHSALFFLHFRQPFIPSLHLALSPLLTASSPPLFLLLSASFCSPYYIRFSCIYCFLYIFVSSSLEIHFYCTYNGLSHCCCSTKNPVRMPWQRFESDTLRHADKVTTFVFSHNPCLAVSSFFLPFLFLPHSFFCIHEENIRG